MDISDILEVNSFSLASSSEVSQTVESVQRIKTEKVLIHIVSYVHNTVLVQNLKTQLKKAFPEAKISLLKHSDKFNTSLVVYNVKKDIDFESISDEVLKELFLSKSVDNESLRECKQQLLKRYFLDNLTHLPNIYQLRKDVNDNEDSGLIVINLDNFKTINNFYGFIVGDFVIEQVGKFLEENVNSKTVYRLSSDEFAVLIEQNMGFYELKGYLQNLYDSFKNMIVEYQDTKIYIDFTLASASNTTTQNIFSKVSMALKYAKDNHLPFWIYEDRMEFENEYEKNLKTSVVVRKAVEEFKIVPYFQSIVDNKTSKITKFECLARLIDEKNNVISPTLFIPIAKKIKVYNIVTKTVIDKSFKTFEDNEFEFNINLSIDDIMSNEIFEFIIDKLKNSSASNRVTFELLESETVEDFKKVERFINEVKRYGAKIAIDDFGSGYSNFSYLTRMSVDYIKIDGSLIKDIDTDRSALLVVETIVGFAKRLGVSVIAEFVHSSTVMDKVKDLGIEYSQGFYIDRPSIKLEDHIN